MSGATDPSSQFPLDPVLIVGAGLSGLVLAQALKKAGIEFQIYEKSRTPQGPNGWSQGYRIRLDGDAFEALESVLPRNTYSRVRASAAINLPFGGAFDASTGAEKDFGSLRVPDRPSHADRTDLRDMPSDCPPIERNLLRRALMEGIEGSIEYNKELESYSSTDNDVVIRFTDGTTSTPGSLVIGADGLGSKVAKQLVDSGQEAVQSWTRDLGLTVIWGRTLITPEVEQEVDPRLLERFRMITDDPKDGQYTFPGLEAMKYDDSEKPQPSIPWVLGYGPRDRVALDTPAESAVQLTSHWKPSFSAIVRLQDSSQTISRTVQITDPTLGVPTWETNPRVTVVGDAIHPQAVTGGTGAITAIRYAVVLARAMVQNCPRLAEEQPGDEDGAEGRPHTRPGWSRERIAAYEKEMREGAFKAIASSYTRAITAFGVTPMEDQPKAGS